MSDTYEEKRNTNRHSNLRSFIGLVLFFLFLGWSLALSPSGCSTFPDFQIEKSARQGASGIKTALEQYRTDYGKWPLAAQVEGQWQTAADEEVYDRLIAVLAVKGESEWIGKIRKSRTPTRRQS